MQISHDSPVYGISVAASLTGVDAQMLRAYEARGLIEPHRTEGGTRRYSNHDLEMVHRISAMLAGGLNLAGIAEVFVMEAENGRLRAEIDALRACLAEPPPDHDRGSRARTDKHRL